MEHKAMIIDPRELIEVEALLVAVERYLETDGEDAVNPQDVVFFAQRPHLLMPLGYDEFRAIQVDEETDTPVEDASAIPAIPGVSFDFPYECFFRTEVSGAWEWFEGITHYAKDQAGKDVTKAGERYLHFVGSHDRNHFAAVSAWFERLRRLSHDPHGSAHTLVLPSIWTPRIQLQQQIVLAETIPQLLAAIANETITLRDLPWRRLEELVAELLAIPGS